MSPSVFFSDDLAAEFLSLLPVKSLLRFKCVSHSWNSLISDPNFVKFHLKKSKSNNPHFTLITDHCKEIKGESEYSSDDECEVDYSIIPYSIRSFLDNPSFTLFADHHYLLNEKDCENIAGSCNGLICLTGQCPSRIDHHEDEYWLRLWNPATRAISEKFGCFLDSRGFGFNFGCDNSTGTFKVVASRYIRDQRTSDVRVLSFGDSVWRNIPSFPVVPFDFNRRFEHAVFFNGTLNWLAVRNDIPYTWYSHPEDLTVEQFVIVSLDLGTETYNMYTLPQGFDEVPPAKPTVGVLGDCLCFSYSSKETDFIIWKMKKFGIEESWTQFLKISYNDLQVNYDFSSGRWNRRTMKYYLYFKPLFLSKDDDTLILYSSQESKVILYNWRDHRVEQTSVSVHRTIIDDGTHNCSHWHLANGFVESLTSIC